MQVNLTANDVEALRTAMEGIQISSELAFKALNKIWKLDFSASKINSTIGTLTANVTALTTKTQSLATAAQAAAQAFSTMKTPRGFGGARAGQGGPGGGGPGSGQAKTPANAGGASSSGRSNRSSFGAARSQEQYVRSMGDYYGLSGSRFKGILDKVGLGGLGGGPGGQWVSKFGNPGQMPLVSRFRVFQRPFPGSERNPFSLGDSGNVLNNAVFSSGKLLETTFRGIVEAGSASVKTLGGAAAGLLQFGSVLTAAIPMVSIPLTILSSMVKTLSDMLGNVMSALGEAIGGVIQGLTTFGLMLSGLASRAVIAASNLTELKNAAQITSGAIGAQKLSGVADKFQAEYGLSSTDSMRMMSRIAQQFRQVTGGSGEQAADAASKVFERVAEAGSVLNMNLDDMSKTVQSALAGRYTPLRRIGVSVSAPYLDQVAKMKGYDQSAKNPFEARLKALMDEIERQTKPFAGDLSATRFEFANQNRKLLGLFEAIFIQAGRILEPFAKSLLYVTNVGLTKFMDFVKGFAESMAGDIAFFQNTGIARDMFGVVYSFTDSLVFAANHVLNFANIMQSNSGAIRSWVSNAFGKIAEAAKELLRYSGMMISWLAGLVAFLPGFLSSMELVKDAMLNLADWVNWVTGNDPKAEAATKYDADTQKNQRYAGMLKSFESGNYGRNSREVMAQAVENARIDAAKGAPLRDKTTALINNGMSKEEAAYKVYGGVSGNGLSQLVDADSMQAAVAALNTMGMNIQDLANTTPAKITEAMESLNAPEVIKTKDLINSVFGSTSRTPEFQSLNLPQKAQMVQYFSPQAFRDEVQNRQVSALESVASSSAQAVSVLTEVKMILQNQNPGNPIDNFLQAPGWPIIVK
jgi:hypothetical protein